MKLVPYKHAFPSPNSESRAIHYCKNNKVVTSRAVRKVRGLTLLLRVGTSWKCDDGLFFEVHPLVSNALLTTLHLLLENVLQTVIHFDFLPRSSLFLVGKVQKSHGAGSGLYGECSDGVPAIHFFQAEHRIQFTSYPM
jgi:hypothetical protein